MCRHTKSITLPASVQMICVSGTVSLSETKSHWLILGSMPVDGIPVEAAAFLVVPPFEGSVFCGCLSKGASITHNNNSLKYTTAKHL